MANRRFRSQFRFGHEAMVVELFMKMDIGAVGAPTLDVKASKGIESVTRLGAGQYEITLEDRYVKLLHMDDDQRNGATAPAAPMVQVESDTVSSDKKIVIQYRDVAQAATDPADGEEQRLKLTLSNSTVGN